MSETEVPRWLSAPEQRAWRNYIEATTLLLDALDRQLQRDAGIPHGYYEILVRLSEPADHTMRMSELAEATRSSRSRLSHAVSRLVERGWIERQDCETDRRGQLAHLTDAGLQGPRGRRTRPRRRGARVRHRPAERRTGRPARRHRRPDRRGAERRTRVTVD